MQKSSAGRSGLVRIGIGIAVVALGASACSSSKKATPANNFPSPAAGSDINTVNTGTAKDGGSVVVEVEKPVDFYNPIDGNGNTDVAANVLLNPLMPQAYMNKPDLSLYYNADLFASEPTATIGSSSAPQTVTYKISPKAVWSDGTPITANDFIYDFLANSAVDSNVPAATGGVGYSDIDTVKGSDNGQTVTVTWKAGKIFTDWRSLFAGLLPEHIAEKNGFDPADLTKAPYDKDKGLEDSWDWFGKNIPTWSGGAFQIDVDKSAKDGTKTVLVPNPKWYGAVKPHLESVTFNTVKDAAQQPPALSNGEGQVMYAQPDESLVNAVKNLDKSKFTYTLTHAAEYEHFDLNVVQDFLGGKTQADQEAPAKLALRAGIMTAVNRKQVIAKTYGLFDTTTTPLQSRQFLPTQKAWYTDNVGTLGNGDVTAAAKILTDAGYKNAASGQQLTDPSGTPVPPLDLAYTATNNRRKTEAQEIKTDLEKIGVTVNLKPVDSLNKALTQVDAAHSWNAIIYGFSLTPFSISSNPPIFHSNAAGWTPKTTAGANFEGYTNSDVDKLYDQSLTEADQKKAADEQNQADKLISKDGVTLPLFQSDTFITFDSKLVNIRDNPSAQGYTYNMQEWGYKA